MHPDHHPYAKFTSRSRLEKSINSLLGIIEGIAIDGSINTSEASFLNLWLNEHSEVRDYHPYSKLVPAVQAALADGVLTSEERADIVGCASAFDPQSSTTRRPLIFSAFMQSLEGSSPTAKSPKWYAESPNALVLAPRRIGAAVAQASAVTIFLGRSGTVC